MASKRTSLAETSAAELDLDTLPGWVNFVKLENLLEVPIEITDARLVPSNFDEKQLCAQVQFNYLDELGEFLATDDEEESGVNQFTTQQRAIMAQVRAWVDEDFPFDERTIGPVTITIYGQMNAHGKHKLCIAEVVSELVAPPPKSQPVPSAPRRNSEADNNTSRVPSTTHRDIAEDTQRQRLAGRQAVPPTRTTRAR